MQVNHYQISIYKTFRKKKQKNSCSKEAKC